MKKDKMSIIYEPSPFIKDKKLLTSLCIYYDDVKLFHHKDIFENNDSWTEVRNKEFYDFLLGPYKVLGPEGIIDIYTPSKVNKYYPQTNNMEIAIDHVDVNENGKYVEMKVNKESINKLTSSILKSLNINKMGRYATVSDLMRAVLIYSVSEMEGIPIITNKDYPNVTINSSGQLVKIVSDTLALMTINKFALPELEASNWEDIIIARSKLKDELIEFRTGILDLTYLLCNNLDSYNMKDIHFQCSLLIDTKIKASILNLEKAIRSHKNSKVRRLIFNSGKLILTGGNLFLSGSSMKDLLSSGISAMDISNEIIGTSVPDHRIASFVYKSNKIFKR